MPGEIDVERSTASQALDESSNGKQAGLDDSFESLYARYSERFLRAVLDQLWRSENHSESVVPTVLLNYVDCCNLIGADQAPENDLWRMLFQVALSHGNKQKCRTSSETTAGEPQVSFRVPDQQQEQAEARFDPPGQEPDREEMECGGWVEQVEDRLKQEGLDERERQVFRLKLIGHSKEEMADQTGFTEGRINALLRRIWAALKKGIEERSP